MTKKDFKFFYSLLLCIVLLGFSSAIQELRFVRKPTPPKIVEVEAKPRLAYIPQFVLISFDGSKSIDLWRDLRQFKEEMRAAGNPVNFTHFINTAYFLTGETRKLYLPPRYAPGHTNIGISDGIEDIRKRIDEVNFAVLDGDEIAPHTTGHHSGKGWSKEEWRQELDSFYAIIFGLEKLYPNANLPKINLKPEDIKGFRAPYLDISPGLFDTLHDLHFSYDTSEVGTGDEWPKKDAAGMWRIPLGTLYVGHYKTPILAMDYNLYVHHTQAQDILKKGTPEWQKAYDEMSAAWRDYYTRNYTGSRAPVLMGYHFGQWNDGVYWQVMKDFAREVCGQPQVRCGTFKELIRYIVENGVPNR